MKDLFVVETETAPTIVRLTRSQFHHPSEGSVISSPIQFFFNQNI